MGSAALHIDRPEFTFPGPEGEAVREAYRAASQILEYGSGGSTVFAGEQRGARIVSVESDRDWADRMRAWFAAHPPVGEVEILHVDIGPTVDWGHPADDSAWKRYPGYALGPWDRKSQAIAPDVVLVDGRFRVGCALATAFRTTRPVTLLFDDYLRRAQYHEVESYLGAPTAMIGRLAVFDIVPQPVPADRLQDIVKWMTRP